MRKSEHLWGKSEKFLLTSVGKEPSSFNEGFYMLENWRSHLSLLGQQGKGVAKDDEMGNPYLPNVSSSFGITPQYEKNNAEKVKLILIDGNHFDVEVILPGRTFPAFRLLLPEFIYAKGLKNIDKVHTYPANWQKSDEEIQGILSLDQGFECSLWLKRLKEGVLIEISIKNISQKTIRDVRVNICAGINHLPNANGADWCNRDFLPDSVPLDRTAQGKHWYQLVTPERLKAWQPGKNWIIMHPHPGNPTLDSKNLYVHKFSRINKSLGCAVMSKDGRKYFYQIWDTGHARFQTPFAGNACMHLIPQVAKELSPGESATIKGMAGVFKGSWEGLDYKFKKFIHQTCQ